MGRTWCRTDPVVEIDGTPYQLTIGIDGDARGKIAAVQVAICLPFGDAVFRGKHDLLGAPIEMSAWWAHEPCALLLISTRYVTPYACTLSLAPRGNLAAAPIPELFGAGLSGVDVYAVPVVE